MTRRPPAADDDAGRDDPSDAPDPDGVYDPLESDMDSSDEPGAATCMACGGPVWEDASVCSRCGEDPSAPLPVGVPIWVLVLAAAVGAGVLALLMAG